MWLTAFLAMVIFAAAADIAFPQEQDRITDQVAVSVLRDQIFAAMSGEGLVRVNLSSGEQLVATEAHGLNALAITSTRLLGFSTQVQRWAEQGLNLNERVMERKVMPRLIVVRTDKRLFGFQGPVGRWKMEEFKLGELPREMLASAHVAVVITGSRALAFSAFHGGFFSQDLLSDETVIETTLNDNIVILSTVNRRLIFRSQVPIWRELR
jgi:hypothetical protein